MLKKDTNIRKEKINFFKFEFKIIEISLNGKNPPEEISDKAKFKELKVLRPLISKIKNIRKVNDKYRIKIFTDCLIISDLFQAIKFVNEPFKFSS